MRQLISSYIDYLSSNPGEFTSVMLWLITSVIITVVLIRQNKNMVQGIKGHNGFMESAEAVTYLICWIFPYIVNYSAFFNSELPNWVWWFMSGCIAWALGGKWLFEWALALRAGSTTVNDPTTIKTTVEVKQETTQP